MPVEDAVMIRRGKARRVPFVEAAGEKQVQLHMHMRTALVDAAAGVAERAQRRASLHLLAGGDVGFRRCA
jgi:hypothetical protein